MVAFYSAKNVTTGNHFLPDEYDFGKENDEEVFCLNVKTSTSNWFLRRFSVREKCFMLANLWV